MAVRYSAGWTPKLPKVPNPRAEGLPVSRHPRLWDPQPQDFPLAGFPPRSLLALCPSDQYLCNGSHQFTQNVIRTTSGLDSPLALNN